MANGIIPRDLPQSIFVTVNKIRIKHALIIT